MVFIPSSNSVPSSDDIWKWYRNVAIELAAEYLSDAEATKILDYYTDAGLLKVGRRKFFRRHYAETVAIAVHRFFGGANKVPTIVDLGCGVGTQSLLFATLGARVVGIDLDEMALNVLNKRKSFYESAAGRSLDIRTFCVDSLKFDYGTVGPVAGVFSMFAFNMMQPSEILLGALSDALGAGSVAIILDGNNRSWIARTLPSRRRSVFSPPQIRREFVDQGWQVESHKGAISVPPVLWNLIPTPILSALDERLNQNWLAPVSHLLIASKQPS